MASVINPVHSPIRTNQISSLYLSSSPHKFSPSNVVLKSRSVSNSSSLAFTPMPEKLRVPALSTGFFGWSQRLRRRGSVELSVVNASASDGAEIEITKKESKGFLDKFPWLITGFFFFMWL